MGSVARKLLRNQIRNEMKNHPKLKKIKHDETETAFSKIFHEVVEDRKKKEDQC